MTSEKISQITTVANFQTGDLFTGIRGGANVNFTYQSVYNAVNGFGTLNSVGALTGIPVLEQPVAGTNNFRKLEASKGVAIGLSPENGISITSSFTQPVAVGAQNIIKNLDDTQYTFRGFKVDSPLTMSVDNDFITFSLDDSPLAQTNTVIISDISDYPDAVAGVITTPADTNYIHVQPITTPNKFNYGNNNSLTSNNPFSPTFTFSGGSGDFITSTGNLFVNNIRMSAPGAEVFNVSSVDGSTTLGIDNLTIDTCNSFGTFDNLRSFNIGNVGVSDCQKGAVITGTDWGVFSAVRVRFESTNASFIGFDFTSSEHQTLRIINPILSAPAGGVGIKGLVASGNVNADQIATVVEGEFSGGLTPLLNINESDVRWDFQGNSGITDSMSDSLTSFSGNALETVSTQSVKAKVNAVWTDNGSSRYVTDSNGRVTYTGEKQERTPIDITATLLAAVGGDKQLQGCLYINGSAVIDTCQEITASSTKAGAISISWQHVWSTGDYAEFWVSNETGDGNIIVTQAVMRIN